MKVITSLSLGGIKWDKLNGQTGFCKILQFPAVFCENLQFPAVFCENLRLPNAVISWKAERKSAKISGISNLWKTANLALFVLFSLSLLIPIISLCSFFLDTGNRALVLGF